MKSYLSELGIYQFQFLSFVFLLFIKQHPNLNGIPDCFIFDPKHNPAELEADLFTFNPS